MNLQIPLGVVEVRRLTNGFIELPPGKWYAEGDEIHILCPDGTEEVFKTSWEADRLRIKEVEVAEKKDRAEALKQHLAEKRLLELARAARKKKQQKVVDRSWKSVVGYASVAQMEVRPPRMRSVISSTLI